MSAQNTRKQSKTEQEARRVLSALKRRKTPATATQLKTTRSVLVSIGAQEVGKQRTGKRGRPAALFVHPDNYGSGRNEQGVTNVSAA